MQLNTMAANDERAQGSDGISEQTRALAKRLSGHMGIEAALKVATDNQWHSVVAVLSEMAARRGDRSR